MTEEDRELKEKILKRANKQFNKLPKQEQYSITKWLESDHL